jgi:hypothetical protein
MKRAIGLIAATLLTASVYSQNYSSGSSASDPDSTPDYQSRQTESGATPSSNSSSNAGYDRAPGLSGGNSSTGQSNGANVDSSISSSIGSNDQTLTTRDSDISGNEYRGTLQRVPDRSFNSELSNDQDSNVGAPGTSVSGSGSSSDETTVKGSGTADGAFHEPAAPVREGSKSEGWSGAGTFSGAGPGAVSGSASSELGSGDDTSALGQRDQDLRDRGLQPDSNRLGQSDHSDMDDDDGAVIIEEWQALRPDQDHQNVGAPGESESGTSSSDERYLGNEKSFSPEQSSSSLDSSLNKNSEGQGAAGVNSSGSSSSSDDAYAKDLYRRTQKDWSARMKTDEPHSAMMGRTVEEIDRARLYNDSAETSVGAPGGSVTGSGSSDDATCHGNKGSAAQFEHGYREGSEDLDGSVRSSGGADADARINLNASGAPGGAVTGSSTSVEGYPLRSSGTVGSSSERVEGEQARYHINRGTDDKYHINREASGDRSEPSAPGEYGDRPTKENYDDGHLNGNNAAGVSATSESSRNDQTKSGNENSATQPE